MWFIWSTTPRNKMQRVLTSALEDARIAVAVSLCKSLHHSVNLLGFSRQTEAPKKLPVKKVLKEQILCEKCVCPFLHSVLY